MPSSVKSALSRSSTKLGSISELDELLSPASQSMVSQIPRSHQAPRPDLHRSNSLPSCKTTKTAKRPLKTLANKNPDRHCGICFDLPINTLRVRCCGALFCEEHLSAWLRSKHSKAACPSCSAKISLDDHTISLASPRLMNTPVGGKRRRPLQPRAHSDLASSLKTWRSLSASSSTGPVFTLDDDASSSDLVSSPSSMSPASSRSSSFSSTPITSPELSPPKLTIDLPAEDDGERQQQPLRSSPMWRESDLVDDRHRSAKRRLPLPKLLPATVRTYNAVRNSSSRSRSRSRARSTTRSSSRYRDQEVAAAGASGGEVDTAALSRFSRDKLNEDIGNVLMFVGLALAFVVVILVLGDVQEQVIESI